MAQASEEVLEKIGRTAKEAAEELTFKERAALADNPMAIKSAIAASASMIVGEKGMGKSALLVGHRVRRRAAPTLRGQAPVPIDEEGALERLDARTRTITDIEYLNTTEVAQLLDIKRQTVNNWVHAKKILGWQHGVKRGYVFPKGQFDDQCRPPRELAEVMASIGDAFETWHWLISKPQLLEGRTPLECLRTGAVDLVLQAAKGDAQGDFV